jgi:hypothetical protein
MNRFNVVQKTLGSGVNEKCPRCLETYNDFMDILGDGAVLGCYKCGTLFVSRELRAKEVGGKKEQIMFQRMTKTVKVEESPADASFPPGGYVCGECHKICKTRLGLDSHLRSHKK